ncbi:plasma protease C1 inhibitor [Eublepharis macularius]|uniref:Plasma protease C1 inhibitor n=1 Tax=Eublepharis macularius TaxID=481883 RepID=A0AA97IX22_EUBMA|nr:plasma protease C1 inhibitor [Eublepharis macularius]XP_054827092.1 plasma protease C1 inhibitor [Eublepharis macularius]
MKTWLIFIYLIPTVISISLVQDKVEERREESQPSLKNYTHVQAEAEGHGLQRSSNSDAEDLGFWNFLRKRVPFQERPDKKENNSKEKMTNPEEEQIEATIEEETADLKAESNTTRMEEESENVTNTCQQARLPENLLLECLNATEPCPGSTATAKPTIVPTTIETSDSNMPQRCQPLSNPWASCNESTVEDKVKLAEALTEFAINFYMAAIQYEKSNSNLVFSPFSISMMFSNLLLGARGQTKEDLEKLLSYPEEFTCIHDAMGKFHKSEAMTAASAIFVQPALSWNNDFYQLSQKFYRSMLRNLTNDPANDVNEINNWVGRNTDHKIKKLLDDLDSEVKMVLVNGVHFHSKWKTTFKRKNTIEENFYHPGLPPFKVFMMTSKKYPLASFTDHILQAKVGRLQLSHNMSLVIMIPRSLSQNLSDVEKRLSGDVFKSMMAKLESIPFKPTVVSVPKFKVDSSLDLMSIVAEMAYGIFFDVNLCGISENEELAVSSARHRAVMEISEEGVEAAAATAVSLARTANFFDVQQPFIFVVVNEKRFPIFMGRIHNPQA